MAGDARCGLARGSAKRLFLIVHCVGTLVTVFLSNDATAVVLTPAVYAATRAAKVEPLPYLFVCAFIANAASFVLPISNPANLVVFGERMPTLLEWLRYFSLPSLVAILATFALLRFSQRKSPGGRVESDEHLPLLRRGPGRGRLRRALLAFYYRPSTYLCTTLDFLTLDFCLTTKHSHWPVLHYAPCTPTTHFRSSLSEAGWQD